MTDKRTAPTVAIPRRARPPGEPAMQPYLQVLSGNAAGQILKLESSSITLGREANCDLILDDPGVSRQHCQVSKLPGTEEYLVQDLDSTNGTHVGAHDCISLHQLCDGDRISLGDAVTVKFGMSTVDELELAIRHYEGATRDSLTRALNRGSFFEQAAQEMALCRRHQRVFSLIMLDVDHFKKVNDEFGHPAGDAVLRSLADTLRQSTRLEDLIGRYGGEEFVLLLRDVDLAGAEETAERVRQSVAEAVVELPAGEVPHSHGVTISLGVAAWRADETLENLVSRADAALYQAKEGGRNRVVLAAPEQETPP